MVIQQHDEEHSSSGSTLYRNLPGGGPTGFYLMSQEEQLRDLRGGTSPKMGGAGGTRD